MTVRWYLTAAFGPHEAGPRWVFVVIAAFGALCATPRAYLFARDIAIRKAAA